MENLGHHTAPSICELDGRVERASSMGKLGGK